MSIVYEADLYYAEKGDAIAQARLTALCSLKSSSFPYNPEISKKMADKVKESAANGNTFAQFHLTLRSDTPELYQTNESLDEVISLMEHYKKVIEHKISRSNPDALFAVGDHTNDLGILKVAAELRSSLACEALSNYYFNGGFFGAYDPKLKSDYQAFLYAQKGAKLNDFYACRCQWKLSYYYCDGIGVKSDIKKAKEWLAIALKNGCYEAKFTKIAEDIPKESVKPQNYNNTKKGCYVATCVYGSYDCPQVWTLRRFRDFYLMRSNLGRILTRIYYKFSPSIVNRFGTTLWFNKIFKHVLDRMVAHLKKAGYKDTEYYD